MDDWFYWRNSRDANSNRARFLLEILSTLDVQNSLGSKNDQTIDIRFYLHYAEDFVWLRPQARPSPNREMRFSTRSILVVTSLLKSCEPPFFRVHYAIQGQADWRVGHMGIRRPRLRRSAPGHLRLEGNALCRVQSSNSSQGLSFCRC